MMKPASDGPLPAILKRAGATAMRKARMGESLRILEDPNTGERFTFHKDHFETGGSSQMFGGRDAAGGLRVFKRLSVLAPQRREESRRLQLRAHGYQAGEVPLAKVTREVLMLREGNPQLAEGLRVLATSRGQQLSKVYLVMKPMRDDFLGCIRGLETELPRVRQSVAWELVAQLMDQIEHLHAHDIVHRDVKSENVLITKGAAGEAKILLADFGSAERATGTCPAKVHDIKRLGVMCLQTLMPHRRSTAERDSRAAIAECVQEHSAFAPLATALLRGDLVLARACLVTAMNRGTQATAQEFLLSRDKKIAEVIEKDVQIDRELTRLA